MKERIRKIIESRLGGQKSQARSFNKNLQLDEALNQTIQDKYDHKRSLLNEVESQKTLDKKIDKSRGEMDSSTPILIKKLGAKRMRIEEFMDESADSGKKVAKPKEAINDAGISKTPTAIRRFKR